MADQQLVLEILKDIQARQSRTEAKLDTMMRRMSTNEEAVANTQRSVDDLGRWLDDLIKAADLNTASGG
ncbi:hypothetical protein [Pseudaestuariivita atlantica]|uniref:Uncharacterized protein n=1 Tax=Pseudaestuariivita atlantica TaxID=1317121 RepID=A0A0L1JTP9_9RHOB|nr:hypothetical protein [Pseudaestuariivita atlantica]KNG95149.1 hypothetical protein ATO11_00400 [Pseudaestuariivita atlantica]